MFCHYPVLVMLYKIAEVHFSLFRTNDCHVKADNERFTVVGLRCRLRGQLADYIKKIAAKSLLHAAQLFFLIQPIKSLICGIAVIYWNLYNNPSYSRILIGSNL